MTLNQILDIVRTLINQESSLLRVSIERFNELLQLSNIDYFKFWIGPPEEWQPGQPINKRGWQIASQATEALKTFLVPSQNYVIDAYGKLNYPANFVHLSDIGYYNSDTSRFRPVEIINHGEKFERLSNYITAPSKEYPIVIYENTYLQFYPIDILNVEMAYLRLPVTPVYAIKQENGIDIYDPDNSTEFEWPEKYHPDLIRMIIEYIAPGLKEINLSQYVETKKAQGV